jgi:N-methylhydantoinase B/oxoprolinase/acetone carboxylase alpha subunit
MLDEFGLDSLDDLSRHIIESSAIAMRHAIRSVPDGVYASQMTIDGYEKPIVLEARLTVDKERIYLDYGGSSSASRFGINSPKCYTDAYSVFGLKCVIAPDVPNNAGSLGCFEIEAEPGSCVAPERPAPVTARHVIGQMLPDIVFGCLAQALPDRVPAESAGSIWVLAMTSMEDATGDARFNVMNVGLGGIGAGPEYDGMSTTAFPSGVGTIPIEVTETEAPLIFHRKELLPDSGGAGATRGGLAQIIEVGHANSEPFLVSAATWDRLNYPARGRHGGCDGGSGAAYLGSGKQLIGKKTHRIPADETLVIETPGGGGFGDPERRSDAQIEADTEAGYVSKTRAIVDYRKN